MGRTKRFGIGIAAMAGRGIARTGRRILTAALPLVLALSGVISAPAPVAAAAHAVPWRFAPLISENESLAGYDFVHNVAAVGDYYLQCPAGYVPASGGVKAGQYANYLYRLLEWPDTTPGGYYHITLVNNHTYQTDFTIAVSCVWADDVGTISVKHVDMGRNADGRTGGAVLCPSGTSPLNVGFDWDYYSTRSVNFSSPVTGGTTHGTGWYVSGYSDHPGAYLGVDLRCVDASLVTTEYAVSSDTSGSGPIQTVATCPSGYRILTGGEAPPVEQINSGVDQGWAVAGPYDVKQYPAFGEEMPVTLRAMVLCVPSSTTSVSFTQTPPTLSTSRDGSITFAAADSAGEPITTRCWLDGSLTSCAPGTPFSFFSLSDNPHNFEVEVSNQYGSTHYALFQWTIDATAPTISSHSPTSGASLSGAVTINFSEPVTGVSTSSVTVHANAANVDIPGTIAHPSTSQATWTPKSRLTPGETYRFSFTSAIHDTAGNALVPTYFNLRTSTSVDSSSSALLEYWDLDASTLASGGSYISSNLSGGRADLTFTATAGQTISLYGIASSSGGYADVYLDGVKKATPSFYAATAARVRVYLSAALTAGSHTISIRPLGTKATASTGTWVRVDSATIGATTKQETSFVQHFRRTTNTSAYGGSYELMTHQIDSDTNVPRFQVTVVGTGVKVYATKTASSGSAKVYVDGVLKATINLHSASTVYQALVYSGTFSLAQHVVQIRAVGTTTGTTSSVDLDRITVT
jgi:hypothetical protein